MNAVPASAQVFLVLGATDMRKAIDGLSTLVADRFRLDPLSGAYFVFCNRGRSIIKVLHWDRNGFCLWQKSLERDRFRWPESASEVLAIVGRDLRQVHGHRHAQYSEVI